MTNRIRASGLAVSALIALLLGACASGGGGGGGSPVSPPPPPPPAPSPPTFPPLAPPHAPGDFPNVAGAEFNANWGPGGTNAQVAWQNNATGAGVLVGVIDDGIHPEHPELAGRISPNSIDIVPGRNALVTDQSHGSELSSLIVGNYNNAQTVGVAFDATILAVRADNGADGFTSTDLAAAINYARQQGVDVINLSLGSANPSAQITQDAIQAATQAGIIIVVSAGNDGNSGATEPSYPGFHATDPNVSNGLIIIAGGLNPNGTVNTASNPPGSAANWYMTAPGWQIIVPDYGPPGAVPGFQTCGLGPNGDLCQIQGTSYASPHITGAVALVMDAFPGLSPAQVVDLLFTTADDTGPAGTDSVNGRGRLNIGRAFQPVGPLAVPLMAGQRSMQFDAPIGVSGAAFGDGMTGNSAAWSVAAFDRYQRTFAVDLSNNWIAAPGGPSPMPTAPLLWRSARGAGGANLQMALAEDVAPDSYRLAVDRADIERAPTRIEAALPLGFSMSFAANGARTSYPEGGALGHLELVQSDLSLELTRRFGDVFSLSFISETGQAPSEPALSLTDVLRSPVERSAVATRAAFDFGRHGFDITGGQINEDRGLLGLSWSDRLGQTPAGETRFVGIGWRYRPAEDWRVSANAEFGVADLVGSSWLKVDEPLRTTSLSFEIAHDLIPLWLEGLAPDAAGVLSLRISQPLRVESGVLSFMAPTANEYGRRSLRYEERSFEPTPSGREMRIGLGYNLFGGESLSAFGEAIYVIDPGHVAEADPDTVLRLGVRVTR
ncbi:MAG: S8 family peptidase [Caulobacteraceae bacterium]